MERLIFSPGLARFCESGVSIKVASCRKDAGPVSGLAAGCRADEDRSLVRLVMQTRPNDALLKALRAGAPIAVTFSEPSTHRSVQLKSYACSMEPVTATDVALTQTQCRNFARELVAIGYSEDFANAYCQFDPADAIAVSFSAEHGYDQTPGPGAGGTLTQWKS